MYFTLMARNLNEAVNMSVASILQFFSLCLSSFAQPSSTRRLSQHHRHSSDVPGFVYIFRVDDGSDRLLFKVGYTRKLDRRRRQWRKRCFPIRHFWSHLRFPTWFSRQQGRSIAWPLVRSHPCRNAHSLSAGSERIPTHTRNLFRPSM